MLRRKLSEAESERDLRIQELESDYSDLKSKLMSQVCKCVRARLKFVLKINRMMMEGRSENSLTDQKFGKIRGFGID